MYKALDLAKLHCETLDFTFDANLPERLRNLVLTSSHSHDEAGIPRFAVYGTTYHIRGLPYAIRAEVLALNDECRIKFAYMQRDVPRPPRSFRSVRTLADALRKCRDPVTIECDAHFVYHEGTEWRSLLELPLAIGSNVESPVFTHIEAIRLANQQAGYSVQIGRGTSGELRHWVSFKWQAATLERLPQMLLEESARLSQMLLQGNTEEPTSGC